MSVETNIQEEEMKLLKKNWAKTEERLDGLEKELIALQSLIKSTREYSILEVATDLERIKRILIEKSPLTKKEKPSKFARMFPDKMQRINQN